MTGIAFDQAFFLFLGATFAAALVAGIGALKILYDVILLWAFRHIKPPEERMS